MLPPDYRSCSYSIPPPTHTHIKYSLASNLEVTELDI